MALILTNLAVQKNSILLSKAVRSEWIFIGGTGRSGTTILSKLLGSTQEIFRFPFELRFLTDPSGYLSLRNALVDNWSFYQGDIAIDQFNKLLKALGNKYIGAYPNYYFQELTGVKEYRNWVSDFTQEFVEFKFRGIWGARSNIFRKGVFKVFGENGDFFYQDNKYCPPLSLENFNEKFGIHLQRLIDLVNTKNNYSDFRYIVDHTPSSFIHFDKLAELIPDAKLIHIYRDPRDVVTSYTKKDWGSSNVEENMVWVSNTLQRWEYVKSKISDSQYIEIKFEDLIYNYEQEIQKLKEFTGLDLASSPVVDISNHNIGSWKRLLSEEEKAFLKNNYSELIKAYGYGE